MQAVMPVLEHEAEHVPALPQASVVHGSPSLQSESKEHTGAAQIPEQQIPPAQFVLSDEFE